MSWRKKWDLVTQREKYLNREIRPSDLLPFLDDLVTREDREVIEAKERNKGPIAASRQELIPRLRRRGPEAFSCFVVALREAGYSHAAQLLDPQCKESKTLRSAGEDDSVSLPGVVQDLAIAVIFENARRGREIEIFKLYQDSTNPETIKLRRHISEYLDQELKPYMTFVKTKQTEANPLVFVFRLSNLVAAQKVWKYFQSGKLKNAIENGLKRDRDEENDLELVINIDKESYGKVMETLQDPQKQNFVFVDGMEKRQLVLEDFQTELAGPALGGENTIICSPTGTGKTFVAIEVINKKLLAKEKKSIAFIVQAVSLIDQQEKRLEMYLPNDVCVASLCGNNVDVSLSDVLEYSKVVVLTAQVLVNALRKKDKEENVSISDFSLLVFDECHHIKGNCKHPYNEIMKWYRKEKFESPSPELPQVIGLSASLGIGTGNSGCGATAQRHIMGICANLDAHNLKVRNMNQQTAATNIFPITQKPNDTFRNAVNSAMEEIEGMLSLSGQISYQRGSQAYENWVVNLCKQDLGRDLMTCADHLHHYNNALGINEEVLREDALLYLEDNITSKESSEIELKLKEIYEKIKRTISSERHNEINAGLQKLEELVLERFPSNGNRDSKGIIFVGTRFVAKALVKWIANAEKLKDVVKNPAWLIGCGQRNGQNGMTNVKQNQEIEKFREGTCNLIVATTALLEGIDIADCNFVINYGMPGNEITHVQARGRMRVDGRYDIIVGHDQRFLKERDLTKEKIMNEAILKIATRPKEEFRTEVNRLQKEAYKEYLNILARESRNPKNGEIDDVCLLCRKCGVVACEASHVKVYAGIHHIIPIQENLKGAIFKTTPSKSMPGELSKTGELSCEACHQRWGIKAKNNYGEFPLLKLPNFRVKNRHNDKVQIFKQWKDFPYQLPKFDPDEVLNLAA